MSNSRTAEKFVVRLPDGMRDRVAETARDNHRSMNSEIIAAWNRHYSTTSPASTRTGWSSCLTHGSMPWKRSCSSTAREPTHES